MGPEGGVAASTCGNLHPYDPEHLIVNGLGGAFLHPTHVFSSSRFASIPDPEVDAQFVEDLHPRGRQMGHAHMGPSSSSLPETAVRGRSASSSKQGGSARGSSPSGGSPRGRSPTRGSVNFPGTMYQMPCCEGNCFDVCVRDRAKRALKDSNVGRHRYRCCQRRTSARDGYMHEICFGPEG